MPKVTSSDGTTIAYDKKGQGPLLILVLGAMNKRGSGKKLTELLQDRFTVVSYDRRGRGDSTEVQPYTPEKEVGDLEALIDDLGGSAYLYGHSSGAILALMAARRLEDKIRKIAVYELPYNPDPEAIKGHDAYREELHQLLAEDKRGDAVALFVKSVGVTDKQIEAMQRLPMWNGLTSIAPTIDYDTVQLLEAYPAMDVTGITTPALVMYGDASPAFMGDTARKLAETLPQASIQPLQGQVHDVKSDVLAPVLAGFFTPGES